MDICNFVDTDIDPCKDYEKNCEYTCSNWTGTLQCACPIGYSLAMNETSCKGNKIHAYNYNMSHIKQIMHQ